MLCARPFTYFISFRLYHKPLGEYFYYYHFINEEMEIKKLSSLPEVT